MAQVTGGLVSVEDGKKAAEEYVPARKVRVDLSFSVGEGEDYAATFDMVSRAASNRVHALLHGTAIASVLDGAPDATAPTATRTRRTKAQIEADNAAAKAKDPAAVEEDPTGGQEHVINLPDQSAKDPAAIEDDAGEPAASSGGAGGGAQTSDDPAAIGDEWDVQPEAPATAVTDADLNSAVQKKNGELEAPNLIRELIGSYNPDKTKPFQLRQIPAEKRAEFLNKLGALKKPAA